MKNIYKFSTLAVALAVVPTFLVGCGGGSSSNSSGGNRADIVFSTAPQVTDASNTNADTRNFNVNGRSNGDEEGVHVGFDEEEFHIFAIDESDNNFRGFQFYALYEGDVTNPDEGAEIDFDEDFVEFTYYDEDEDASWIAVSGTATILSNKGNKVTIGLDDVLFVEDDGNADGSFIVDGTISYNENDIEDERGQMINSSKAHKVGAAAQSKAASANAKKGKKPFVW